ncbi:MAG: MFS transporter [Rhodospirillaceae bacterium]|nr:MFS transporter [Rhodospirillaceae bacterium]
MNGRPPARGTWLRAAILLAVGALSVGILLFVGQGEALRTYGRFQLERLRTQADVVRTAMEPLLNAGLPLRQFGGFENLAKRVLDSDKSLVAIAAFDTAGRPVYAAGRTKVGLLAAPPAKTAAADTIELRADGDYRQATARLVTRFGEIGTIAVTMDEGSIAGPVAARFGPLAWIGAGLSLLFAAVAAWLWRRGGRIGALAAPVGFTVLFVAMSVAVGFSLLRLYEDGATAKTQALAASLAQRLQPFVTMGLSTDDFSGLDRTFANYRRLNPDVSALALVVGGRVAIDTDRAHIGRPWQAPVGAYVYETALDHGGNAAVRLAVALPTDLVWRQVLRSGKDFAALFIAAILLARMLLGMADTLGSRAAAPARALALLRPAFLVAVLAENLIVSFLPQHLARVAAGADAPGTATSILFMAYFLSFALSLAPAGQAADRIGPRPVIVLGAVLAALGFVPLVLTGDFLLTAAARALAGIGQGLLLAGTQAYVLRVADASARTQGTSIIVYGFNAGMIAGAALGSLLANFVGQSRVIVLGACLTGAVALYAALFVPRETGAPPETARRGFLRDLGRVIGNLGFLRTLLLIGAPAKAVLTGVVVFALPLLLSRKGYPPQDIGQIVMLYALGVLFVTGRASRLVDRRGESDAALFWGSTLSGLALAGIGLVDWPPAAAEIAGAEPWLIAAGVFLLGIAHGFINAPVVTNVAGIPLAREIGAGTVAATYRFLERTGHVAGPIIVGQLLAYAPSSLPLLAMGAAIALFGVAFALSRRRGGAMSPA